MRCLVTGAAGFIGSHLCEALLERGHEVVGLDGFVGATPREEKEENLRAARGRRGFSFLEMDLKPLTPGGLPDGVEAVFHLAARPGVRESWGASFEAYAGDNILATQRLLEALAGVPLRRFIYASSSSVYGEAAGGEAAPVAAAVGEEVPPRPLSPYGLTKLAGEHLCWAYARRCGLPTIALRYFTVYGPRQRPDMAFRRFLGAALRGEAVEVYGDGEQSRDFTYVGDAVAGTLAALEAGEVGGAYNLGGGSRATVNEVIEMVGRLVGRRLEVRRTAPRAGDVRHTWADTSRARLELGYSPRTGLEEGLAAEHRWLVERGRHAHR